MVSFDIALSQNLLEITIGHGAADLAKDGMRDHGFRIVRAFEINRHRNKLLFLGQSLANSGLNRKPEKVCDKTRVPPSLRVAAHYSHCCGCCNRQLLKQRIASLNQQHAVVLVGIRISVFAVTNTRKLAIGLHQLGWKPCFRQTLKPRQTRKDR